MPLCSKRGPYRYGMLRSVWKNLTPLHRFPDLNPTEHLWDELDRLPQARPNRPTSVPPSLMLQWLNGSKSTQQCSNMQCKAFPEEGGFYSSKGGINSILMLMILECDIRRAYVHILLFMQCMYAGSSMDCHGNIWTSSTHTIHGLIVFFMVCFKKIYNYQAIHCQVVYTEGQKPSPRVLSPRLDIND